MTAQTTDKPVAVVTVAGSQHLVSQGQKITVNRLKQAADQTVTVPSLLDETPVILKVLSHTLGEKVNGLKFKNKVRYIKRYGHRQHQTVLEVISIGAASAPVKTVEKTAVKKAAAKPVTKKTEVANG